MLHLLLRRWQFCLCRIHEVDLTPEDRRELYFGITDPREELLGDTSELALGILTMAIRYPNHFINWSGSDGANACVRGLERSIWRYAAAEAIELLTADQPRRRSPPRRDEDVENYIRSMTQGLAVVFEAVVDGDREFPQQPTGEVSTAPPMPEESAGSENVQPEEEDEAADLNHGLRQAILEQVSDMVGLLETGKITVGTRELTFCVACGSSRHTLRDCHTEFTPILRSLQHMWLAIQNYPTPRQITIGPTGEGATNASAQPSEGDVSMEVETGSAASSTTRRPKAKARPRQPTVMANVIIIRCDNPRDLGTDFANRRGKYLVRSRY